MDCIYMEMPAFSGTVVGVYVRGTDVPNDPGNEEWTAYQAFLKDGGTPLAFDPALQWDGTCWIRNDAALATLLASTITDALVRIDQFHAGIVQQLVGNPTQVEKDTWPVKLDIADRVAKKRALTDTDRAFLTAAGITDGTVQQTWAASVLSQAAAYASVVGVAERLRNEAKTAVKAAASANEIAAILATQRQRAADTIATLQAAAAAG